VLSQVEMDELQRLCDKVPPFDSAVAMAIVREELGPPPPAPSPSPSRDFIKFRDFIRTNMSPNRRGPPLPLGLN